MKRIFTLVFACFIPIIVLAQLGSIDPAFSIGTGAGGTFTQKRIETMVQQPDGKILIGGWFVDFNGTPSRLIVRLNLDGSVDNTFNVGTGFEGTSSYVNTIALQPDGKILVGGNFLSYNGVTRHRIARLHPNGTLDESFVPGTGFNSDVNSIALQSDGKIVVGGIFSKYDWLNNGGINRQAICRLNSDGSLDNSFDSAIGFSTTSGQLRVNTVIVQPDGKIICGGLFTGYKGVSRILIARLNTDASLDTTFNAGNSFVLTFGFYGEAWKTVLLPDGKIITAGNFQHNGANNKAIVKLNSDGSVDTSMALNMTNVTALAVQSDGRILASAGGPYTFRRYLANGVVDTTFPTVEFNDWARHCIVQQDGNILIGGWFSYNPSGLMRLIGDTPLSTVEQSTSSGVKIYPNPASHNVTIDMDKSVFKGSTQIQILDIQGRSIKQFESDDNTTTLSISDLPRGTYFVKIHFETSQIVKKLVVR